VNETGDVLLFHRDHLDAAFGFRNPDAAMAAHNGCEVGVCACRTAATIRLRGRWKQR
jgi:hypothetical protein